MPLAPPRALPGSSPHTRGALSWFFADEDAVGIIPAYAGSTLPGLQVLVGVEDHPRIRGEHFGDAPAEDVDTRIIPAYAGSTRSGQCGPHCRGDHPRIRGEHSGRRLTPHCRHGSSPHTRGALAAFNMSIDFTGIIPAYAGSTTSAPRCAHPPADHPRIRGEHWSQRDTFRRAKGSSPHTRGALRQQHLPRAGCGIIPAYAGSTGPSVTHSAGRKDHPRIRGEHYVNSTYPALAAGSSPHTRGALVPA